MGKMKRSPTIRMAIVATLVLLATGIAIAVALIPIGLSAHDRNLVIWIAVSTVIAGSGMFYGWRVGLLGGQQVATLIFVFILAYLGINAINTETENPYTLLSILTFVAVFQLTFIFLMLGAAIEARIPKAIDKAAIDDKSGLLMLDLMRKRAPKPLESHDLFLAVGVRDSSIEATRLVQAVEALFRKKLILQVDENGEDTSEEDSLVENGIDYTPDEPPRYRITFLRTQVFPQGSSPATRSLGDRVFQNPLRLASHEGCEPF